MANSTIISAHRHGLRLSFDTLKISAQRRSLDSESIDVDNVTGRPRAATMKGTDFTACTPSKSINPFAEGRTACAAKTHIR